MTSAKPSASASSARSKRKPTSPNEITGLLGIYTDPHHVIACTDGEVRQEFNITYYGRVVGGVLAISQESTDVRFVDPAESDRNPIHDRLRLRHRAEHRAAPYLG